MKAALLREFGKPLEVGQMAAPEVEPGEVVVDIVAAPVLPYMDEVLSGSRNYLFDLPQVPGAGAVGRIRAIGPDATKLRPGDWVFCDATVRSRDDAIDPDITLHGLSAGGVGGLLLQKHYRNGSFAEQMRLPTENVFHLGAIGMPDAAKWCAMGVALVPYGGWLAIGLQPGEIALVSGATGFFGSAGVAAAIAMGASCVVAPGRNEAVLRELDRRFGDRVRTVRLTGDEDADRKRMVDAAPGPIDCVLDLLPPSANAATVRTAVMALRRGGRAALMGGVGMQDGEPLCLPHRWIMRNSMTIRGQWMYSRQACVSMIALAKAGLLDLDSWHVSSFALDDANAAVAHAAREAGAFKLTVIQPSPPTTCPEAGEGARSRLRESEIR